MVKSPLKYIKVESSPYNNQPTGFRSHVAMVLILGKGQGKIGLKDRENPGENRWLKSELVFDVEIN